MLFFFFQAEDGIRDIGVTGVQTCALPILLSYAVNLFIFSTGGLRTGAAPILERGAAGDLATHADPVPQALVLTAIVIGFATTALFLVVLLAARGLTGTDQVDGREEGGR